MNGSEGDVMVNFPEFWYKWVKIDNNKFAYKFSLSNIEGDWVHVGRSLVGAYKGYTTNTKLLSKSGVKPDINIAYNNFILYTTNKGSGYRLIDFQQHCTIAFMLYAKYKTRNLQNVLGSGTAGYEPTPTATGTSNTTGIADTKPGDTGYVCGLGIEGVYGGICEYIGGVIVNGSVCTITNQYGSTRNVNINTGSGWITGIVAENGPFFDMIPTKVGGSQMNYYSDYFSMGSNATSILSRSYYNYGAGGGVAYIDTEHSKSNSNLSKGSRLAFRGIINEIKDVNTFKSLPLL